MEQGWLLVDLPTKEWWHSEITRSTPVSLTGQAPGLAAAAVPHFAADADSSDANLQHANAWLNLFSLSYPVYLFYPTFTVTTTPLHLHLITHYLDHLWSSTRLESPVLSLHSFESCILVHVCSSWGQVLHLSIPPRHSCALTVLDPTSTAVCLDHVSTFGTPCVFLLRVTFSCIHSVYSLISGSAF
jgi:hypothetical protein